jgi:hypothetical protein
MSHLKAVKRIQTGSMKQVNLNPTVHKKLLLFADKHLFSFIS